MTQLQQLTITLIPVLLLIFWIWMFSDMTKNDEIPSNLRQQWFLAFIFLNFFAAILYYFTVYRHK